MVRPLYSTSPPSHCSRPCLDPPAPPPFLLLGCTKPLARFFLGLQRRRRKPRPPLSSYLFHLVTHAFGLRYFTPNYRGHPIQNDDDFHATPSQNDLAAHAFVFLSRIATPPRRVLSPVISCLACTHHLSHPLPYAILMHLHFHHLHLSHRHRYSRHHHLRAGLFDYRLSCIECNNRFNFRLW